MCANGLLEGRQWKVRTVATLQYEGFHLIKLLVCGGELTLLKTICILNLHVLLSNVASASELHSQNRVHVYRHTFLFSLPSLKVGSQYVNPRDTCYIIAKYCEQ